jgi:hypothetical protein
MRRLAFALVLFLTPTIAAAQSNSEEKAPAADIQGLPIPSWVEAIIASFNEPAHPVVGGIAPGGGIGVGFGYTTPRENRWFHDAEAMVTFNRYWSLEGETGVRSARGRSQIGAFGQVRHMGHLDYFGLGPNRIPFDRSDFRLRETTVGARGWFSPAAPFRIGGSAAMYLPDVGPGSNPSVLPIELVFADRAVPGLTAEPTFGRYRGFIEVVHPIVRGADPEYTYDGYRGAYQLAVEAVRDHDSGRHDFHRWEAEVQQRIPGFSAGQRLTLHGFVAITEETADVPFYMLYTLGGGGGLKAFRPDLFGSDGSRATLRSYRNFRFRDRDLVLMQAEYRIPIVNALHATVFVDAGQVAPRRSQLFRDIRTGTGFSLAFMRKGSSVLRMDVGLGGGEGVRLFWSFGSFTL